MVPEPLDWDEPGRLARAIGSLKLKHAVITSVARDDVDDGGARHWAETIRTVKKLNPGLTMEVLIPDFRNNRSALDMIISSGPEVISHNLETVKRLSPKIRRVATYETSLDVLRHISRSGIITKTGIMLGFGETYDEVIECMSEARAAGATVFTIGQYLQPGPHFLPVVDYIKPGVFKSLREEGLKSGFDFVESGPLVRSSYHAERHLNKRPSVPKM